MLSSALEPKLARLLPCDAPVTASIDEVSQASEARFAAANKYWQSRSAALKSEIAAVEHTIALEQSRTADWTRDHADADQERTSVDAHVIALQRAVEKAPSLVDAEKQLRALAAATQQTAARSEARESAASSLIEGLRDVLRADQTQQNSVGAQLRSVAAEEAAYKEYYAARTARARTECTITGSSEPVVPASPRRTVPKRTSPIKPVAPPSASAN